MAEFFPIDLGGTGNYYGNLTGTASYAVSASYAANGGGGGGSGSIDTSSLLTTASFTSPNMVFTKGDNSTFNVNISKIVDGGTF